MLEKRGLVRLLATQGLHPLGFPCCPFDGMLDSLEIFCFFSFLFPYGFLSFCGLRGGGFSASCTSYFQRRKNPSLEGQGANSFRHLSFFCRGSLHLFRQKARRRKGPCSPFGNGDGNGRRAPYYQL